MEIGALQTGGCPIEEALAKVFVLYTGGTIGMLPADPRNPESPLVPAPLDELLLLAPGLGVTEKIHLGFRGFEVPLDSTEVVPEHWLDMAQAIEDAYDDYDGFVILHGTDTMAYTASGLSFICENLAKPIVVTGSQLPIAASRTDAVQNLVSAVHIAGYKATKLPLIPEVVLCFADRVLRGNRTRKISTAEWVGFDSPNYPVLGRIGEHIVINRLLLREPADNDRAPFFVHRKLVTDVIVTEVFPGLKSNQLAALLKLEDVRGVVLKTYGVGNAPGAFSDVIGDAIDAGKVIVNITQCPQGSVEMGLYAASSNLLERGVISGLDMTPEAAVSKLFWALEAITNPAERVRQLQISQRGEQSEHLFDLPLLVSGQQLEAAERHEFDSALDARFELDRLTRAVTRINGLNWGESGAVGHVKVFIGLPPGIPTDSPAAATYLAAEEDRKPDSEGDPSTTFIRDVTAKVGQFFQPGFPIAVTVVSETGPVTFESAYLAVFTRV